MSGDLHGPRARDSRPLKVPQAGANLVRLDGHDLDGVVVTLVTVEALGETRTQTLAVVK